jgi:hypothetical protein
MAALYHNPLDNRPGASSHLHVPLSPQENRSNSSFDITQSPLFRSFNQKESSNNNALIVSNNNHQKNSSPNSIKTKTFGEKTPTTATHHVTFV